MSQVTQRTQRTQRSPSTSPYGRSTPRTLPAAGVWLFGGVVAAGLGLGAYAVLVLLLWIISPYPGGGASGALHLAADLWLLGQGADLTRLQTLSGTPAPVALTPLLLSGLPAWLLYRAASQALAESEDQRILPGDDRSTLSAVGWVGFGHLLTGAAAVLYASDGPLRVDVASAALALPLFASCVGALAAWTGYERLGPGRPHGGPVHRLRTLLRARLRHRLPASLCTALARPQVMWALRAAARGTATLCAGGLVLTLGTLVWHAQTVRDAFPQLTEAWSGWLAMLLLAVALLPNAAVWAASYGLGPGFALGVDSMVGPLAGATGGTGPAPRLPHFPLLAALPAPDATGPLVWVMAGALPVVAAVATGRSVARAAAPEPGRPETATGWRVTACVAALAACGCALAVALLAALAGGPLGTGALARFGPSWWLTGSAALVWTGLVGVPGALVVRAWRLREAAVVRALGGVADEWHTTASRRTRWAAIKTASGGLMPDFEPHSRR